MGHEIHGQRTWTQGAVLMQALNILENFDLREMGHNSTTYIHTVSQALNLAFADREAYYGDPDFAVVPVDGLLSKEYARERAAMIDPGLGLSANFHRPGIRGGTPRCPVRPFRRESHRAGRERPRRRA